MDTKNSSVSEMDSSLESAEMRPVVMGMSCIALWNHGRVVLVLVLVLGNHGREVLFLVFGHQAGG